MFEGFLNFVILILGNWKKNDLKTLNHNNIITIVNKYIDYVLCYNSGHWRKLNKLPHPHVLPKYFLGTKSPFTICYKAIIKN